MDLNDLNMFNIEQHKVIEEIKCPQEITSEYLFSFIKTLNEDIEIIHLYSEIENNKELIDKLVGKINIENESQLNIQSYMTKEYLKIYKEIKKTKKLEKFYSIFTEYGTTNVLDYKECDEEVVLLSLPLERSSNCSYLYHEDKFCEKLIDLRYNYKKNRAYAYNFIELVNENNVEYNNLNYFNDYLESY